MDGQMLGWQRRHNPLKTFDGRAANKRATVAYVGGKMLHQVIFEHGTHNLTRVDLRNGSDVLFDLSVDNAMMLQRFRKIYEEAGFVVMPFAQHRMKTLHGQVVSALNTYTSDKIVIGATFGAGADPDVSALALESDYDLRNVTSANAARFLPRTREVQLKGGSAGRPLQLDNINSSDNGSEFLSGVHLYGGLYDADPGAGTDMQPVLNGLRIIKDKKILAEYTIAQLNYILKTEGFAPQDGWLHFDPQMFECVEEMFNTGNTSGLIFEVDVASTVANIPAIIESLEFLPEVAK